MGADTDLRSHLLDHAVIFDLYLPEELLSEPLLNNYNILEQALEENAETILVTRSAIIWRGKSSDMGRFEISPSILENPDLRFYFNLMLDKDSVVASHLELIHKDENSNAYRMI